MSLAPGAHAHYRPASNTPAISTCGISILHRYQTRPWGLGIDAGLNPETVQKKSRLENNLINVAKICLANRDLHPTIAIPVSPSPQQIRIRPPPHRSEKGAKLALHKSRAAFLALMAWISFLGDWVGRSMQLIVVPMVAERSHQRRTIIRRCESHHRI